MNRRLTYLQYCTAMVKMCSEFLSKHSACIYHYPSSAECCSTPPCSRTVSASVQGTHASCTHPPHKHFTPYAFTLIPHTNTLTPPPLPAHNSHEVTLGEHTEKLSAVPVGTHCARLMGVGGRAAVKREGQWLLHCGGRSTVTTGQQARQTARNGEC